MADPTTPSGQSNPGHVIGGMLIVSGKRVFLLCRKKTRTWTLPMTEQRPKEDLGTTARRAMFRWAGGIPNHAVVHEVRVNLKSKGRAYTILIAYTDREAPRRWKPYLNVDVHDDFKWVKIDELGAMKPMHRVLAAMLANAHVQKMLTEPTDMLAPRESPYHDPKRPKPEKPKPEGGDGEEGGEGEDGEQGEGGGDDGEGEGEDG